MEDETVGEVDVTKCVHKMGREEKKSKEVILENIKRDNKGKGTILPSFPHYMVRIEWECL